jgi:hypothetical protein
MPRNGRGGKVAGAPGKAYSNRSDLNGSKSLPVETATGQTYGKAAEQRAAQRAIPLQAQPTPQAVPGGTATPPFQQPTAPAAPIQVPDITAPGSGIDAMREHLGSSMTGPDRGMGGFTGAPVSQDPEHLRLLNLAQQMANGPYSSSGIRDLADFMQHMVK